jgi:uncharacterized protein (TIGR03067 family)
VNKEKYVSKIRTVAFVALLIALPALADEKDSKSKLDGTYTVVSGHRDGKELPKADFEKSVVTFEQNKIFGHDRNKKEFFGAVFTIDTSSKPWKISMVSTGPKKGEKADGIIDVEGDNIRLAYALPGGKTPTTFTAGANQQSFTLKRVPKKEK